MNNNNNNNNNESLVAALRQASNKLSGSAPEVVSRLLAAGCVMNTNSTVELGRKCPLAQWYRQEIRSLFAAERRAHRGLPGRFCCVGSPR